MLVVKTFSTKGSLYFVSQVQNCEGARGVTPLENIDFKVEIQPFLASLGNVTNKFWDVNQA